MKVRFGTLVAISILVLLAFSLAACEKDRPVPTPTRAASTGASATAAAATRAPQANATQLALPVVGSGAAVTGTQGITDTSGATTQSPEAAAGATQQPGGAGSGQPFTYTVVKGDSLTSLAKKFGVTQESILTLNGLTNPNVLKAGQTLKIPGQGTSTTETSTSGSTYTVQAGDTLSKIAVKFGVTTKELIAANNIANPDVLTLGKVLTIPTGGTTTGNAGTTTGTGEAKTYVVQAGDTLAQIAAHNGVTLNQLMAANNITSADQIYSGQTLKIP
jgi:LysM repeat protein